MQLIKINATNPAVVFICLIRLAPMCIRQSPMQLYSQSLRRCEKRTSSRQPRTLFSEQEFGGGTQHKRHKIVSTVT